MQIWNKCKKGFENSLPTEQYATWISPLEFVESEKINGLRSFYILAPNDFIKEYIRTNLDQDFRKQIENGGPLTITDPKKIRYFMTIKEAVDLVIQAAFISNNGDVCLLEMGEPIKIFDLAKQMILLSGLKIKDEENPDGDIEILTTGLRPGEKLYEELLIEGKCLPTSHPLIYRSKAEIMDQDVFLKKLDKLISSLNSFDKGADIIFALCTDDAAKCALRLFLLELDTVDLNFIFNYS